LGEEEMKVDNLEEERDEGGRREVSSRRREGRLEAVPIAARFLLARSSGRR